MKGPLEAKTFKFAIKIVRLYKEGLNIKYGYLYFNQVFRCGTAIGALVRESEFAESKKDFLHKLSIALKEANETAFWLNVFKETELISVESYEDIYKDCQELLRLLISITKTLKKSLEQL